MTTASHRPGPAADQYCTPCASPATAAEPDTPAGCPLTLLLFSSLHLEAEPEGDMQPAAA
jgi:hypothetical protein